MPKFLVTDKPHLYPTRTVKVQRDHLVAKRDNAGTPGLNYTYTAEDRLVLQATERVLAQRGA